MKQKTVRKGNKVADMHETIVFNADHHRRHGDCLDQRTLEVTLQCQAATLLCTRGVLELHSP